MLLFTIFQRLTAERRLTGQQFLVVDIFPTFLNAGTANETFRQSGKQDSFRHVLKSAASMHESSGLLFCRATTRI